ncbi:MAG: deoxyribodipyrimidine photo-lyase [Methanosarcinales archaeon]|nr:deoxyribodipyrimidine photo-lyase [Methanosarcinales archaeon]
MNLKRVKVLREGSAKAGPVIYWMSRDQRVRDNWALIYAQSVALKRAVPLAVIFSLALRFLGATWRQYSFMLSGLSLVERQLQELNIPFHLLSGKPAEVVPDFLMEEGAGVLVTDFDPLREKRSWKAAVARKTTIPFYEVDAHNIVPCWQASPKQEYAAYTIRPKIGRALAEYLEDFPALERHPRTGEEGAGGGGNDWDGARRLLESEGRVPPVRWLSPGEDAAWSCLQDFVNNRLDSYPEARNDPSVDGQSNLSPYLHFGQLSAQRVALEVQRSRARPESRAAFLEELIVRRELSDNFCFYNPHYDGFQGFPTWARETLDEHRDDAREYIYTSQELEEARTHDDIWNAAQMEMVRRGKMHGYLRMYWCKKILEWSESPEVAQKTAIGLNDRYELDGRDPNGYVGVAWSVGGVHDRAWGERNIFGKIRYMSYKGIKSKFDIQSYISRISSLPPE